MNTYTRGLAEFASGLQYERIPADVRERLKLLILDALGCALYGAELEWCRILRRTLQAVDKAGECRVWGTNERLSAPLRDSGRSALVSSNAHDEYRPHGTGNAQARNVAAGWSGGAAIRISSKTGPAWLSHCTDRSALSNGLVGTAANPRRV